MDNELNAVKQKVKRELADFLGTDMEDIEDDSVLTEDLHMSPSDITDFTEILKTAGYDASQLDFTEIETFSDLIEALTAHI